MNIFFKAALGIFFGFLFQASSQEPTPTPAPAVEQDYHQLLDEVRQGGLEEFQKRKPATPEEYREYLHLLTQLVESETLADDWGRAANTLQKKPPKFARPSRISNPRKSLLRPDSNFTTKRGSKAGRRRIGSRP